MENRSHALLAGIFTVSFLVAGVLALWWLSGQREATHAYILTTRGSVAGLNLEAPVRYRGIRAGKVTDIRPDPVNPSLLLVDISVAQKYPLTDKTIAKLNSQGVTGIAYVMLEENGAGGVPLSLDVLHPPRLEIQPGLLHQLGEQAADLGEQVSDMAQRFNRLLDDRNLENLSRSLDNLARASAGLKELPPLAARLKLFLSDANLAHTNALLAHLEQTAGTAAPLALEAREAVARLNRLAQQAEVLTQGAGALSGRLEAETLPRAAALMRDLSVAARNLERLAASFEDSPQALLFGAPAPRSGPGETGFSAWE